MLLFKNKLRKLRDFSEQASVETILQTFRVTFGDIARTRPIDRRERVGDFLAEEHLSNDKSD
jgi:hypothetical protein